MPWKIENGKPVQYSVTTPPPEVPVTREFDEATELVCPECGRPYKTQQGLSNHIDTKHGGLPASE